MDHSWSLFHLFLSFLSTVQTDKFRSQWESNSDRRSRNPERWPPDNHHGPHVLNLKALVWRFSVEWKRCVNVVWIKAFENDFFRHFCQNQSLNSTIFMNEPPHILSFILSSIKVFSLICRKFPCLVAQKEIRCILHEKQNWNHQTGSRFKSSKQSCIGCQLRLPGDSWLSTFQAVQENPSSLPRSRLLPQQDP